MFYALERAGKRPANVGREIIHTDSLYALNMTRGKWMPRAKGKRNAPLIERLRKLWRKIQRARPGEVTLRHVRSHIQVPGNELADWLAERGALSQDPTPLDHATSWMRSWLHDHCGPARDTHERPPGGRDRDGDPRAREAG